MYFVLLCTFVLYCVPSSWVFLFPLKSASRIQLLGMEWSVGGVSSDALFFVIYTLICSCFVYVYINISRDIDIYSLDTCRENWLDFWVAGFPLGPWFNGGPGVGVDSPLGPVYCVYILCLLQVLCWVELRCHHINWKTSWPVVQIT